jgi:hypothetical protein
MRIKSLFLILLLFLVCNLSGQEKYKVLWDYKDMSFKEFAAKAETMLPVKFFYRDDWVAALKLSDYQGCQSLSCIMDYLMKGSSLLYIIDESGNVVITGKYSVKVLKKPEENNQNFIPPTVYVNPGKDQKKIENATLDIGSPSDRNKSGNVTISGYIKNNNTKEPLPGVTVYIQKLSMGTITNGYGFYTLSLPRGSYQVQFSFIGLKEKKTDLNLYGNGEMNVEMESKLIALREIVVSSQKNLTLQRFEAGVEKINISSFRLLPTSLGETDIIKNLNLLPGVQSVGEGSAGFNVRGGSADQNLILLYGAPIYNSSHFFGFFSSVNSDIIKDVTLYKGGIPGRYGGRISSVLDIETKEGNRKEFSGNAGISPITTHIKLEGPLIKDTLTYMLTGRTTYSNWIFGLIKDPSLHNSRASFYDFNGKMTYYLNKNNKFDLSSYFSHDKFRFNSNTIYGYDNNIFALKWQHFFSARMLSVISINNSLYKYDISNLIFPTGICNVS